MSLKSKIDTMFGMMYYQGVYNKQYYEGHSFRLGLLSVVSVKKYKYLDFSYFCGNESWINIPFLSYGNSMFCV